MQPFLFLICAKKNNITQSVTPFKEFLGCSVLLVSRSEAIYFRDGLERIWNRLFTYTFVFVLKMILKFNLNGQSKASATGPWKRTQPNIHSLDIYQVHSDVAVA